MECNNNSERIFSIELYSKEHLKRVIMTNNLHDNIVIEGSIGQLVNVGFVEGIVLEVTGEKGVLRLDLGENEVRECIKSLCFKNQI
jgi:hypothetical protein